MKFYYSLLAVLSLFVTQSLVFSQELPFSEWSQSKSYTKGDVVYTTDSTTNEKTYYEAIADQVNAGTDPRISDASWKSFEDIADGFTTPTGSEDLKTPDESELEDLEKPDLNSSSSSTFYGLAIRGAIGDYPIAGSFVIKGTSSKKVKIRVKGPTMNFKGVKVSDPKITIQKLNESTYAWEAYLIVDNWGDHEDTKTNYPDEATSDPKEPVAILDLEPGTYSVRVQDVSESANGSANVEFYGMDDDTGDGRFFGLAIRAAIGDYPIAGSFVVKGTSSKKVKIRVKGPTMNFKGVKVSDPKITIQKLNESTYAWEAYLIVDNWGDHEDTKTNYSDEATSDPKEPVAILDLEPGTYSVRVQDVGESSNGSANVEFYEQE